MYKILIPWTNRSDYALVEPMIKLMKEHKEIDVKDVWIDTPNECNTKWMFDVLDSEIPDLVLCPGDRVGVTTFAYCSFIYEIPIAHLYGGIKNHYAVTFDDFNRWCITLWSDIIFVEDELGEKRVRKTFNYSTGIRNIKGKVRMIHIIGNVLADDLSIDTSLVPDEPYDLLLYNPNVKSEVEIENIVKLINEKTIIIEGNDDPFYNPLNNYINQERIRYKTFYLTLPRDQFLGLLKNCEHFITNSSSAYYEAPYFLKKDQIILVGLRNKRRSTDFSWENYKPGASKKVVDILYEWLKENVGDRDE